MGNCSSEEDKKQEDKPDESDDKKKEQPKKRRNQPRPIDADADSASLSPGPDSPSSGIPSALKKRPAGKKSIRRISEQKKNVTFDAVGICVPYDQQMSIIDGKAASGAFSSSPTYSPGTSGVLFSNRKGSTSSGGSRKSSTATGNSAVTKEGGAAEANPLLPPVIDSDEEEDNNMLSGSSSFVVLDPGKGPEALRLRPIDIKLPPQDAPDASISPATFRRGSGYFGSAVRAANAKNAAKPSDKPPPKRMKSKALQEAEKKEAEGGTAPSADSAPSAKKTDSLRRQPSVTKTNTTTNQLATSPTKNQPSSQRRSSSDGAKEDPIVPAKPPATEEEKASPTVSAPM